MMPLFRESPADVIHLEMTNKDFVELEAFGDFPKDKVLGVGVVDAKNTMVESVETIADRIRRCLKVVPADRLLVSPGLRARLLQPHHGLREAAQHGPGRRGGPQGPLARTHRRGLTHTARSVRQPRSMCASPSARSSASDA